MIYKKDRIVEFMIVLIFVLIGISLRLLPHSPNFVPIGAIALFGGVYLSRKIALMLPLTIILISDMFLDGYHYLPVMVSVYGSFLLTVIVGVWLKKHKKWYVVGGSAVLTAILFFLITNFAVWAFTPLYANNFSGLIQCYLLALPFFRNTLLGNIFYATCFFGVYELMISWVEKRSKAIKIKPGSVPVHSL